MNECAKCGADQMIDGVHVLDRGAYQSESDLAATVFRRPEAILFKGAVSTPLTAQVCARCGFIELYATEPALLVAAVDPSGPILRGLPAEAAPAPDRCLRCGGPMPEEETACRSCGWTYSGAD
jgi:ribosomal protein L40E